MIALICAAALAPLPGMFEEPKVVDAVLAEQRGGIRLPNGIDVALTIQTDTSLNGALLLRSIYRIDQGTPNVIAFVPRSGQTVAGPRSASSAGEPAAASPVISYDRASGLHIVTAPGQVPIAVTSGPTVDQGAGEGLRQVDLSQATQTDAGVVSASMRNGLRAVELRGADIGITHLAGDAIGSAIVNAGSDRAIDTLTTASIDLRNAGPDVLGSSMLKVENLTLDALASRL